MLFMNLWSTMCIVVVYSTVYSIYERENNLIQAFTLENLHETYYHLTLENRWKFSFKHFLQQRVSDGLWVFSRENVKCIGCINLLSNMIKRSIITLAI